MSHPLMQSDGWVVAMNAGILVHCIIAYQINLNVWCVWLDAVCSLTHVHHVLPHAHQQEASRTPILVSSFPCPHAARH